MLAVSVTEHDALLELIGSGAAREDGERAARAHRAATLRAVLDHEARTTSPYVETP